jgi:hypothetical protein
MGYADGLWLLGLQFVNLFHKNKIAYIQFSFSYYRNAHRFSQDKSSPKYVPDRKYPRS